MLKIANTAIFLKLFNIVLIIYKLDFNTIAKII